MILGGLQKLTLLDFPGNVACTVFTVGCNLRCPFCHNPALVFNPPEEYRISEDEFFAFLKKRQGILDGVAITGGEPLLRKDRGSLTELLSQAANRFCVLTLVSLSQRSSRWVTR